MLDKEQLEWITRNFLDRLFRLTGIKIERNDLQIVLKSKELVVRAWNCTLTRIRYSELEGKNPTEYILNKAVGLEHDLRRKIIKCKIYDLTRSIPSWADDIKKGLLEQKISDKFVNSLEFKVIDHGYKYQHYTAKDEAIYDYPYLAINISNSQNFNFSFPINVYDVMDPIDIDELKHNLFIAILEKSIPGRKGLRDL